MATTTLRNSLPILGFSIIVLTHCRDAAAATICVDPGHAPTDLFTALTTWANATGAATTIKVAGGTYAISASLTQLHDPASPLVLLGGYKPNTGCDDGQRNITAYATNLDGGGTGVFGLEPAAPVTIDGLTFSNYFGGTTNVSGAPQQGVVINAVRSTVTLTRFIAAHVASVYAANNSSAADVVVQNCLVYNQPVNATLPALRVSDEDGHATVRNCTIAGNAAGGLQMETFGEGQFNVYNTISFNNANGGSGGYDFSTGNVSNQPNVFFSLYSSGFGFAGYSNIVPISNYALFAPGSYHLAQQSLAINSGDPNLSYPPGETDLDGNTRIAGSRIDMGAYESSYVPNQLLVNKTGDDGSVGTLHWAIAQANLNAPSFSTIVFNLGAAAGCPYTIALNNPLDDINASVFIDGTTQPGWSVNNAIGAFSGTLCVRIVNGASVGYAFHTAPAASASQVTALGMIFAGFNQAAIKLEGGSGHNIGGNWFGGPALAANHFGVQIAGNAANVQIGGADPVFANVIDKSGSAGIFLSNGAGSNLVQNNVVGMAPDGMTAEGNPSGIYVSNSPNNTLRANFVGNSTSSLSAGIVLYGAASTGNVVQQNLIGWDYYGGLSQPNAGAGIFVGNGAANNVIGSSFLTLGLGNSIRYSAGPGVWITGSAGGGNYVVGNDLVGNGGPTFDNGLAIDLGSTGPDANSGQNAQNYPVLRNSFAMPNSQLIQGTLDGAPNQIYRIDFYHLGTSPAGYPGRGDAGLFAGFSAFATDANGHCAFLITLPQVEVGGWLNAAVTPLFGNTSENGNAVPDQLDAIHVDGFGGINACQ